ncbi:MAG: homoserine dehydrogenase [Chloroflexota bacterium]
MTAYRLCFIGFGNVGRALARLLIDQSTRLRDEYGIEWKLSGIASRRLGWLADPAGLDVAALLDGSMPVAPAYEAGDVAHWLPAARADVLFEMSSLNAATGQPAISYLQAALQHGAHAVTANKGPIVHGYRALRDLAASTGKSFRFESTVMDGAPIFSLFRSCLPLARLSGFRGILNSTTNVILERMEAGADLAEGIRHAQALGLAETDPIADVDGWDAAVKVAALTAVLMDYPLPVEAVEREGIRAVIGEDVRAARAAGTPYKLVCWARRREGMVEAGVGPVRLPLSDPLARVDGASSAVHFDTDLLPGLTMVEHQPTPVTTAYGMLADFIGLVST